MGENGTQTTPVRPLLRAVRVADPGHGALSVVVAERHPHGASRDGTYLHRDDVIASVGQVLDAEAVLDDLHHESEYEMLANRLRAKLDELGLEIL